jgi:drug/metabolite transporter (DMT)-like permease
LEGGIAYALYYTYPVMILLFSGEMPGFSMCLALLGIFILYKSNENLDIEKDKKDKKDKKDEGEDEDEGENPEPNALQKIAGLIGKFEHSIFPNKKTEGYVMILLAALAQASIYFLIRRIKTKNHWNHLFISYFFGAGFLSLYYFQEIQSFSLISHLSLSLLLNICVGLAGYMLRFFAMYRLPPNLYAPLSYFGVVMAVLYGVLFNAEKVTNLKILGVLCLLLSNIIAVINAYRG